MMQRHTSEALLNASRQFADLRLPSPYFQLMINQNLCLPIIAPGIICPCGQEIDIYGDHFFQCKKYSKMQPSNRIRDCIHFIIAETGQHAGLISSK
jgi:hypothetical protein